MHRFNCHYFWLIPVIHQPHDVFRWCSKYYCTRDVCGAAETPQRHRSAVTRASCCRAVQLTTTTRESVAACSLHAQTLWRWEALLHTNCAIFSRRPSRARRRSAPARALCIVLQGGGAPGGRQPSILSNRWSWTAGSYVKATWRNGWFQLRSFFFLNLFLCDSGGGCESAAQWHKHVGC